MPYVGSCHCGDIRFTVAADPPGSALSCNCSNCRRKGLLLTIVPRDAVTVETSSAQVASYFFNKHVIEHRICGRCGCEPIAFGKDGGGARVAAINLRCVSAVDLRGLRIREVDGASA